MRETGATRSLRQTREGRLDYHIFGWLSLIGVAYASVLFFWNMFDPEQEESRVHLHCNISKLTILTIAAHLLSQPISGLGEQWVIWTGLGFYLIIVASGIVLLYMPDAGILRYHARSIHPALLIGLAISLIYHVLTGLKII
jgi:hypothetical protein